jgi:hypothetical protein
MSLRKTLNTSYWNSIPKKCKNCIKAIYTLENGEILYQCSIFGTFKRDCELKVNDRKLPKPEEILNDNL